MIKLIRLDNNFWNFRKSGLVPTIDNEGITSILIIEIPKIVI